MIEVTHVSKQFGPVHALRDVSLSIEPGERVAFVGSNGSGKTTLLRALLGLLRITGKITIEGFSVASQPEFALRKVAYVPQISPPLDAPTSEVITAYAGLRAMDVARMHAHAHDLGLSVAAIAKTRFRDLSGGMKQKLLAALALATDAQVLVCDEPTANLDAQARVAFFAQLDARPANQIVILCSHREDEVLRFVDRVVELSEGHLKRDQPSVRTKDAVAQEVS